MYTRRENYRIKSVHIYAISVINIVFNYVSPDAQEQLMDVYDRLEDLSADTAEARAANILHGLGFTRDMQQKATKDFSGGLYHRPHRHHWQLCFN